MDQDLAAIQETRDLLERSAAAQRRFAEFSQEAVDRIVDAVAAAGEREARRLAELACRETGYGNVADKTAKNLFAARTIYQYIRPLKTVGVLREEPARGLVEIACPKGVVAAIIPSTNPTSKTLYKVMISLKAGCGIVLSPHPAALECVTATAAACIEAAEGAGAPAGIVGCLTQPGERATSELMRHRRTGVILATGGLGLVRAAYSAGKPAFGVGPGNVPAFIERTADVDKAVRDIITSTTFDYGTICSSEQAIVVDRPVHEHVLATLEAARARLLSAAEIERLGPVIILPGGRVNPKAVGRSAATVAALAGIGVPDETSVLVAPLDEVGSHVPLSLEKLSPVLALYVVDGWEKGCERCVEILSHGGLGHTMSIHSRDERVIMEFGRKKPVFRIVVNSPTTHGAIGFSTGADPSMTLGCGALGGNITSDNITPLHLIDRKRLLYEIRPVEPGGDVPGWPVGQGRPPVSPPLQVAARTAPPPVAGGPRRDVVERVVREFLSARGGPAPAAPPPACATPSTPPAPVSNATPAEPATSTPRARLVDVVAPDVPVEFVCEDDVRAAIREQRTILVCGATIITPSARDLGQAHGLFRRRG